MSNTPTPRTDEAQFGTGRVSVDFARQLERELALAIAERDDALTMLGVYKLACDEQKKEIANLRARLESDAAISDWKRKNGKA